MQIILETVSQYVGDANNKNSLPTNFGGTKYKTS